MAKKPDHPFSPKEQRFIHLYVNHCLTREIEWIAEAAGFKGTMGLRLYKRPEVRAEIDRRQAVEEQERARLKVHEEIITDRLLDENLKEIILLDPKEYAREKRGAIALGYVLRGRIRMGTTEAIVKDDPNKPRAADNFYRAFESTTTTVREVTAGAPPLTEQPVAQAREPVTIEAQLPPPVSESGAAQDAAGVWKY